MNGKSLGSSGGAAVGAAAEHHRAGGGRRDAGVVLHLVVGVVVVDVLLGGGRSDADRLGAQTVELGQIRCVPVGVAFPGTVPASPLTRSLSFALENHP